MHSAIILNQGKNQDIHGNIVPNGAYAVFMTDDSCSLHWSHMASALYVWLSVCSALRWTIISTQNVDPLIAKDKSRKGYERKCPKKQYSYMRKVSYFLFVHVWVTSVLTNFHRKDLCWKCTDQASPCHYWCFFPFFLILILTNSVFWI